MMSIIISLLGITLLFKNVYSSSLMEKDVKECGQLASPVDASMICADNNLHVQENQFRLLTCKVLCPPGYVYPNQNNSVFYCTSDVGYWYEYPTEEITEIKDCIKTNLNVTFMEKDAMRVLQNFSDQILSGKVFLNGQKLKNNESHEKPKVEEIKNISTPRAERKTVKIELTKDSDYYYIPKPKINPLLINPVKNKKIKTRYKPNFNTATAKTDIHILEKNINLNPKPPKHEAVQFLSNLLNEQMTPFPKNTNFKENYQKQQFYVNTLGDQNNLLNDYWKNEEKIHPPVITPSPPIIVPIIITPVFKYESWNNFEKYETPYKIKTTPAVPDQFWHYFENKDNPITDTQYSPPVSFEMKEQEDLASAEWKRDLYETKGSIKVNKTEKISKDVSRNVTRSRKKKSHQPSIKSTKNKISVEEIIKSGILRQLTKLERQKILQIFKDKNSEGKLHEKICIEIPLICQINSKASTKGDVFVISVNKNVIKPKNTKKIPLPFVK